MSQISTSKKIKFKQDPILRVIVSIIQRIGSMQKSMAKIMAILLQGSRTLMLLQRTLFFLGTYIGLTEEKLAYIEEVLDDFF